MSLGQRGGIIQFSQEPYIAETWPFIKHVDGFFSFLELSFSYIVVPKNYFVSE